MLDYSHYEERSWHSSVSGERMDLPSIAMPDNGCAFDIERMRETGYTFYIDSQHPDREKPTRWWFRSDRNLSELQEKIQKKGFVFVGFPHLV